MENNSCIFTMRTRRPRLIYDKTFYQRSSRRTLAQLAGRPPSPAPSSRVPRTNRIPTNFRVAAFPAVLLFLVLRPESRKRDGSTSEPRAREREESGEKERERDEAAFLTEARCEMAAQEVSIIRRTKPRRTTKETALVSVIESPRRVTAAAWLRSRNERCVPACLPACLLAGRVNE
jgi:hypothetical protein